MNTCIHIYIHIDIHIYIHIHCYFTEFKIRSYFLTSLSLFSFIKGIKPLSEKFDLQYTM